MPVLRISPFAVVTAAAFTRLVLPRCCVHLAFGLPFVTRLRVGYGCCVLPFRLGYVTAHRAVRVLHHGLHTRLRLPFPVYTVLPFTHYTRGCCSAGYARLRSVTHAFLRSGSGYARCVHHRTWLHAGLHTATRTYCRTPGLFTPAYIPRFLVPGYLRSLVTTVTCVAVRTTCRGYHATPALCTCRCGYGCVRLRTFAFTVAAHAPVTYTLPFTAAHVYGWFAYVAFCGCTVLVCLRTFCTLPPRVLHGSTRGWLYLRRCRTAVTFALPLHYTQYAHAVGCLDLRALPGLQFSSTVLILQFHLLVVRFSFTPRLHALLHTFTDHRIRTGYLSYGIALPATVLPVAAVDLVLDYLRLPTTVTFTPLTTRVVTDRLPFVHAFTTVRYHRTHTFCTTLACWFFYAHVAVAFRSFVLRFTHAFAVAVCTYHTRLHGYVLVVWFGYTRLFTGYTLRSFTTVTAPAVAVVLHAAVPLPVYPYATRVHHVCLPCHLHTTFRSIPLYTTVLVGYAHCAFVRTACHCAHTPPAFCRSGSVPFITPAYTRPHPFGFSLVLRCGCLPLRTRLHRVGYALPVYRFVQFYTRSAVIYRGWFALHAFLRFYTFGWVVPRMPHTRLHILLVRYAYAVTGFTAPLHGWLVYYCVAVWLHFVLTAHIYRTFGSRTTVGLPTCLHCRGFCCAILPVTAHLHYTLPALPTVRRFTTARVPRCHSPHAFTIHTGLLPCAAWFGSFWLRTHATPAVAYRFTLPFWLPYTWFTPVYICLVTRGYHTSYAHTVVPHCSHLPSFTFAGCRLHIYHLRCLRSGSYGYAIAAPACTRIHCGCTHALDSAVTHTHRLHTTVLGSTPVPHRITATLPAAPPHTAPFSLPALHPNFGLPGYGSALPAV